MSSTYLRDSSGRTIGQVSTDSTGQQTLYDASGRVLGRYSSGDNTTRDASGRTVGHGNVLSSLLNRR